MTYLPQPSTASILVIEDENDVRQLLAIALRRAGYEVVTAASVADALERIAEATPDLILSDVMMPDVDGFALVSRLRSDPQTRSIPLIFLTARGETDDRISGLLLGADDYITKPFDMGELLARVRSKVERPPVPVEDLPRDRRTGLLGERPFRAAATREIERARRAGRSLGLARVEVAEWSSLRERLGARSLRDLSEQVARQVQSAMQPIDVAHLDAEQRIEAVFTEVEAAALQRQLQDLARAIVDYPFQAAGGALRLTPVIGYAMLDGEISFDELRDRSRVALSHAESRLDLQPVRFEASMRKLGAAKRPRGSWLRAALVPLQVLVTILLSYVIPFLVYLVLDGRGYDVAKVAYLLVVLALLLTAVLIWVEGLCALRAHHPPNRPDLVFPPASAIIAAYLPNEASTVGETIEAFLRVEYPGPLQIILAYNTPRDLPIEETLFRLAEQDPRFLPLRVEGSTSKAQNVNAALSRVTGAFVGVFDADHHPDPSNFTRAWRWLASECDIVQGHCFVRNGEESWVARTVAVEFEAIYAVSHPGRARLHGFGIFGGSNGYWKTDLLRQTRMHGFMLTEDIDSSMRVVEAGYRIISDPLLVSRELAPVTLKALWNQRLRWAQGWFQVSVKHFWLGFRSRHLSARQKLGLCYLLGWREIYPWLSVQVVPIIAFWSWKYGGLDRLDWLVPIFVLTSLFTLCTGPGQTYFAYRLADHQLKSRKRWFWAYLVVSSLFYTEFKNTIARLAQVKELMGERQWKVTPRTATAGSISPT